MRNNLSGIQQYISLNEARIYPTLINLHEIIATLEKEFKKKSGDDVLHISSENLPSIYADYNQIYQLFYYLFENVVQFKKPGEPASVDIKGTVVKQNKYKINPDKYKYVDFLKITIADKGIGFDPRYKSQIFDLFNKLHHLDQSGLGLSYCKLIVENHGGFIEADSHPMQGTTIIVNIPMLHSNLSPADAQS
jgi:phosphoserine phosphatase RsbU/P